MRYSFVRFIIVGIVNTIVGLSFMYLFLHALGLTYWMSTFLGNSVGAIVSYFLNRKFTFQSQNSVSTSAVRFVIVILCCYFISYQVGERLVVWLFHANELFNDKVIIDFAVLVGTGMYTFLNYFGQRVFVFPKNSSKVCMKNKI
ncbi:GtrA family protein [Neobacillus sp. MM2021_6]|uniref:GtrA family protein n=1 Tax=Bacillaceae TaxID=186817 RepID=UPI00140C18B4|nr:MULTISPECIES: GtrA family protein [Bacillaceae]MBO0961192.1 GtrA family protein [Neobacillus sp. MM2021_6]NHC19297.1 GtrA family protein [Bacillus sp. MM2020_4]